MIYYYIKKSLYGALILSSLIFHGCKKEVSEKDDQATSSVADHWQEGDIFLDKNNWTECVVGNIPLVITAPHGGRLEPSTVPDRACPNITTGWDSYTMELARAIENELVEEYHVRPYIVINHLHRNKIDQNREINEATCGNAEMQVAWHQFHDYIDTAVSTAAAKFGRAIYIDLHGHGHEKQRLELGYSLNINEIGKVFTGTDLIALGQKSSLQNLLQLKPQLSFQDLMIGDIAFGTLMENEGIHAVPSQQDPYVQMGDPYFNGGYNSRFFTSAAYPTTYGWQIESNYQGVRNNDSSRAMFAKAFAKVIMQYLEQTKL